MATAHGHNLPRRIQNAAGRIAYTGAHQINPFSRSTSRPAAPRANTELDSGRPSRASGPARLPHSFSVQIIIAMGRTAKSKATLALAGALSARTAVARRHNRT